MRALSAIGLFLFTVAACGPAPLPPIPESPGPNVKDVSLADVGLDASAMDRTANPCEDFYQFACGGWVAKTEIPSDKPRWVRSFSEIHQRNEADLRRILEQAMQSPKNELDKKIGTFFAACMDQAARDAAKVTSIAPLLAVADGYAPPPEPEEPKRRPKRPKRQPPPTPKLLPTLSQVLATLHEAGISPFFAFVSTQDFKDATKVIGEFDQAGLGLPDRSYYLDDDDKMKSIRAFYLEHVARMFGVAGAAPEQAKRDADTVLKVETSIATISKSRVERRDPAGMYNRLDRKGMVERQTGIDWSDYLKARNMGLTDAINVTSVPFIEGLGKLATELPRADVAVYLRWQVLHATAGELGNDFVNEDFKLAQKLFGQEKLEAPWKRCVAATDTALGELLAQAYVAERFSPQSKQAVIEMVTEVGRAFRQTLGALEWMDTTTRERAQSKLSKMDYLIGYPDEWRRYDFDIDDKAHATNSMRAAAFEVRRDLAKIGKPVDDGEWYMTPPTVNAYYSALRNHMVFPAGILQPPFYNPNANIAVNLGAMGMVVGHELTHGFDDKGSQFDGDGNLSGWWEPITRKAFEIKTKCVQDQYAGFEALPGVKLNGELTLGENIADAGGVKLAFTAYRALRENTHEVVVAESFDEDQQFFLSIGQVWCSKYREEFARARAKTDTHSQPNWRVNGSLMNTPEFALAFGCDAGTPMNPPNACRVW
jgi:putative endopeptidase